MDWYNRSEQIYHSVMVAFFVVMATVISIGVHNDVDDFNKTAVENLKTIIISINGNDQVRVGKQHTPVVANTVLFKVADSSYKNQYFKLTGTGDGELSRLITDEWVYNHSVGDTIVFKCISNKRFFTIKER
jgi:hypothetical protein